MAGRVAFARRALRASAVLALLGAATPSLAQDGARAVVQPLPPPEARMLSEALTRLAANPQDLDALIAAGNASLKLDDIDAALGFFERAGQIAPADPRTKAGLAATMVKEENPFEALRLFDEAERAGASLAPLASERALAYDLVGDNARAQQLYREVLARGEDPETSRRLAVSLAISGDQAGMERVLLPMLQRKDLAAYRARAFSLAILGKVDEATTISDVVMPKSMAAKMAPYLRYMPKLTRAQQAAAANLGNFPRTADIGHDDARVARYDGQGGTAGSAQAVDARLVPAGAPLGPAAVPTQPQKLETTGGKAVASYSPIPPETPPEPTVAEVVRPAPTQIAAIEAPPSTAAPAPAPPASVPAPSFDLAQVAGSRAASPQAAIEPPATDVAQAQAAVVESQLAVATAPPAPAPATAPQPVLNDPGGAVAMPPASVASAFADFDLAPAPAAAPAAGAVDIARIAPPREKPVKPEPAKPVAPKQPSRHWVQVATGKDRARLATDWKRISANSNGVLKDAKAYLADWGATNRLLTGPFKSDAAAQAFVTKLDGAGIKAFAFTSDEGEEVSPLAAR